MRGARRSARCSRAEARRSVGIGHRRWRGILGGSKQVAVVIHQLVRGHLRFLRKHQGLRTAERARQVMLWGLSMRGVLFRGERGRAYRDTARWLRSGKTASLLGGLDETQH